MAGVDFFKQGSLKFPSNQLENGYSASKPLATHKRAYFSIAITDHIGDTKSPITAAFQGGPKIGTQSGTTYKDIIGSEGSRVAPKIALESLSIYNDGGQDISDAVLFSAEIKIKIYSLDDFNTIEKYYCLPGQYINITFGWINGESKTIGAAISGFDFSINQDGSFDLTLKGTGMMDGILGKDETELLVNPGVKLTTTGEGDSKKEITPTNIVQWIAGLHQTAFGVDFEAPDGKAVVKGNYATANHQQERGGFWSFDWASSNDNNVGYVNFFEIVELLNQNIKAGDNPTKGLYSIEKLTTPPALDEWYKSPNPPEVLLSWASGTTKYGDNADFSAIGPQGNLCKDIWLSIPALTKIYENLLPKEKSPTEDDIDKTDVPKPTGVPTHKFLQKVFGMIKTNTAGLIQPFTFIDPNKNDGKIYVLNKRDCFPDTAPKGDTITVLNSSDKAIREINLTSNLDADFIAMAANAGRTGENSAVVRSYFGSAYETSAKTAAENKSKGSSDSVSPAENIKACMEAIGDGYTNEELQAARSALVKYIRSKGDGKTHQTSGSPYALNLSFKADGFIGARFGQAFSVDRLPARLANGKVYFMVTKIGHEISNGDWTTEITGVMMLTS